MNLPYVSFTIGICAFNEHNGVKLLLEAICSEKFRHYLREILIVSTCSCDGTDEAVESFASKGPVRLFRETERKGKYTCVNTLVHEARLNKSDVLVLIPADVLPYPRAIDSILGCFSSPSVGCVSGHPVPQNLTGFSEHIAGLLWELHHETFLRLREGGLSHASSELMAFRPSLVGPLPAGTVIDDTYIANQIVKAGRTIEYMPEAYVAIWVPRTLRDFWIQRLKIVRGHRMLRKNGMRTQEIALLPMRLRLHIVLQTARRRRDLAPYVPVLVFLETLLHLRARFGTQPTAWRMASTAKPRPSSQDRTD